MWNSFMLHRRGSASEAVAPGGGDGPDWEEAWMMYIGAGSIGGGTHGAAAQNVVSASLFLFS